MRWRLLLVLAACGAGAGVVVCLVATTRGGCSSAPLGSLPPTVAHPAGESAPGGGRGQEGGLLVFRGGPAAAVLAASLVPAHTRLTGASDNGACVLVSVPGTDDTPLRTLVAGTSEEGPWVAEVDGVQAAVSSDGCLVASISADSTRTTLAVYEVGDGARVWARSVPADRLCWGLAFSPDSRSLAVDCLSDEDGRRRLDLYDARDGTPLGSMTDGPAPSRPVSRAAWTADGAALVFHDGERLYRGNVGLWSVSVLRDLPPASVEEGREPLHLRPSSDGATWVCRRPKPERGRSSGPSTWVLQVVNVSGRAYEPRAFRRSGPTSEPQWFGDRIVALCAALSGGPYMDLVWARPDDEALTRVLSGVQSFACGDHAIAVAHRPSGGSEVALAIVAPDASVHEWMRRR